jgi:cyclic pyranopterin phosphate synthase
MTEHFCDTCNRVRITAVGDLHTCLAYDDAVSLRSLLRSGGTDGEFLATIRDALAGKVRGHDFQRPGGGAPTKHMISIGG